MKKLFMLFLVLLVYSMGNTQTGTGIAPYKILDYEFEIKTDSSISYIMLQAVNTVDSIHLFTDKHIVLWALRGYYTECEQADALQNVLFNVDATKCTFVSVDYGLNENTSKIVLSANIKFCMQSFDSNPITSIRFIYNYRSLSTGLDGPGRNITIPFDISSYTCECLVSACQDYLCEGSATESDMYSESVIKTIQTAGTNRIDYAYITQIVATGGTIYNNDIHAIYPGGILNNDRSCEFAEAIQQIMLTEEGLVVAVMGNLAVKTKGDTENMPYIMKVNSCVVSSDNALAINNIKVTIGYTELAEETITIFVHNINATCMCNNWWTQRCIDNNALVGPPDPAP